ncbi:MAG: hypothetical protein J6T67_05910 [Paludibacteraceae bacterium]|nr:hypothetical protein [Paludibacteraceae bacterium]
MITAWFGAALTNANQAHQGCPSRRCAIRGGGKCSEFFDKSDNNLLVTQALSDPTKVDCRNGPPRRTDGRNRHRNSGKLRVYSRGSQPQV